MERRMLTGAILLDDAIDMFGFHGVHDEVGYPRDGMAISMDSDSGDV